MAHDLIDPWKKIKKKHVNDFLLRDDLHTTKKNDISNFFENKYAYFKNRSTKIKALKVPFKWAITRYLFPFEIF